MTFLNFFNKIKIEIGQLYGIIKLTLMIDGHYKKTTIIIPQIKFC